MAGNSGTRAKLWQRWRGRTPVAAAIVAGLVALTSADPARAQIFETKAAQAILVDVDTDTVLFQRNADQPMPPASMAKLMTMAVVFDALREGRLTLDEEFLISENAWRKGGTGSGGSTMFAKVNSSVALSDLIRGVIVQSGNDASIAIAEGLAGTEEAFADIMNAEAKRIGLRNSHFRNATGLPDPQQYVTARDLALLARYIIEEHPEYYRIYSETEFTWNKIRQTNRNPLLAMNIGADGMKTGFTEESGYGLVGSAVRDGRRLIVVINGTTSERERSEEARKLLEWGFRSFNRVSLFGNGEVVAEARVFGGAASTVGLVSKAPVDVMLPSGSLDRVKVEVAYDGPVPAPVSAGQEIGVLRITIAGEPTRETKLYAAEAVGRGGIPGRAVDGLRELLLGWW